MVDPADSASADSAADIVAAIGRRDRELAARLSMLSVDELANETLLPGWSALTIICHLRYGAEANLRVTEDMLAGSTTSYYPEGRAQQRDATLRPGADEAPEQVVASLVEQSASLLQRWSSLAPQDWERVLVEPADNRDLGPVSLRTLALLRLTEVEVHGTDLAMGLDGWSETFVAAALPMRLHWLARRRSNHRAAKAIDGVWRVRATDGPSVLVALNAGQVVVSDDDHTPDGAAVIEGTATDLLGFLLGRVSFDVLSVGGDEQLAARFLEAFPAP